MGGNCLRLIEKFKWGLVGLFDELKSFSESVAGWALLGFSVAGFSFCLNIGSKCCVSFLVI